MMVAGNLLPPTRSLGGSQYASLISAFNILGEPTTQCSSNCGVYAQTRQLISGESACLNYAIMLLMLVVVLAVVANTKIERLISECEIIVSTILVALGIR